MNVKKLLIPGLALSMYLSGCMSEEAPPSQGLPINVNVSIAGHNVAELQKSRAGKDVVSQLTEFYLDITNPTSELYSYNALMRRNGNAYESYSLDGTSPLVMRWANLEQSVSVKAATFKMSADTVSLSVSTDQTSADNLIDSDHLAQKPQVVSPSMDGVNVNLSHIMAKLYIVVRLNGELSTSDTNPLTTVSVEGTKATGTYNIPDGTWRESIGATATPVKARATGLYSKGNGTTEHAVADYEAILVPQTVAENTFGVRFEVGGKDYVWTSSEEIELQAGNLYTVNITVGKYLTSLDSIGISGWNDAEITGGEAEEEGYTLLPGYTTKVSSSIYRHEENTDLYVVYGADNAWHKMVDLGVISDSGKPLLFATTNLGAKRESESGGYYTYNEALATIRDTLGAAFRLPTRGELHNLVNMTSYDSYYVSDTWEWASNGFKIYSITAANSAQKSDSYIFLPAAGDSDNIDNTNNNLGLYLSSTDAGDDENMYVLSFNSDSSYVFNRGRYDKKFSVRPVVELQDVVPPQGYTTKISDGIYQHGESTDLYVVYGNADRAWHDMVDLGVKSESGKTLLFATMNVGAINELDSGVNYSFDDAMNSCPYTWGTAFRLPTIEELKALGSYGSSSNWGTTSTGYDVYKISASTLEGTHITLPYGNYSEDQSMVLDHCVIWSSTISNPPSAESAYVLEIISGFTYTTNTMPYTAQLSVRLVVELP